MAPFPLSAFVLPHSPLYAMVVVSVAESDPGICKRHIKLAGAVCRTEDRRRLGVVAAVSLSKDLWNIVMTAMLVSYQNIDKIIRLGIGYAGESVVPPEPGQTPSSVSFVGGNVTTGIGDTRRGVPCRPRTDAVSSSPTRPRNDARDHPFGDVAPGSARRLPRTVCDGKMRALCNDVDRTCVHSIAAICNDMGTHKDDIIGTNADVDADVGANADAGVSCTIGYSENGRKQNGNKYGKGKDDGGDDDDDDAGDGDNDDEEDDDGDEDDDEDDDDDDAVAYASAATIGTSTLMSAMRGGSAEKAPSLLDALSRRGVRGHGGSIVASVVSKFAEAPTNTMDTARDGITQDIGDDDDDDGDDDDDSDDDEDDEGDDDEDGGDKGDYEDDDEAGDVCDGGNSDDTDEESGGADDGDRVDAHGNDCGSENSDGDNVYDDNDGDAICGGEIAMHYVRKRRARAPKRAPVRKRKRAST